ncbi:MAG: PIG-L family deacetylase [Akkermansiaceae bacterium]|nr:PIG-L family deacetylase [Akkermansiaceae bacterium]
MKGYITIVLVCYLNLSGSLTAALVTWSQPAGFTNTNQINTDGTLVEAKNLGGSSSVTMNGVSFSDASSVQYTSPGGIYYNVGNYTGSAITGLDLADTELLLDTLEFGSGDGNSAFTLTGLTPGKSYLVQVLLSRDQMNKTIDLGYADTVGGTEVYTVFAVPYGNTNASAQMATATFTANATSQELHFRSSSGFNAEVCALQLRQLPQFDQDGDQLPDAWERSYGLDPNDDGTIDFNHGADGDPDSDGSNNYEEYLRGTDPKDADSDNDLLLDGVETNTGTYGGASDTGTDPNDDDTDNDGLKDGYEVNTSLTDPTDYMDPDPYADADDDGMPNIWETNHGLDPADDGSIDPDNGYEGDPDGDGLPNGEEYFRSLPYHDGVAYTSYDPQVNEFTDHAWEQRPGKAHLMVIHAHPDDEGIFMGGLISYATQARKLNTVVVNMVSSRKANNPNTRETELRNACWAYGLRNHPINLRFMDHAQLNDRDNVISAWDAWDGDDADGVADANGNGIPDGREAGALAIASQIRRYRPEVVASHDLGGEYGHGAHQATGICAVDAYSMAADPTLEIDGLPPWQVKKLYLHRYGSNRLFHDYWQDVTVDTTGNGTPDKSPFQMANEGLDFHVSQGKPNVSTIYQTGEVPSDWAPHVSEEWGLHSTEVGLDTTVSVAFTEGTGSYDPSWAKGDFFENLSVFPDTDSDTLADAWEMDQFGSLSFGPAANTDGDPFSHAFEFVAGMNPNAPDADPLTLTSSYVQFTPPAASGPGYDGLTRRYRLWRSTDLGSWSVVAEGIANGSTITHALTGGSREFFKLEFILE